MPRHTRRAVLVLLALLLVPAAASGDWINLVNGGRITGEIVRQNEKEITIRTKEGAFLTVQMRQIAEYFSTKQRAEKPAKDVKAPDAREEVIYKQPTDAIESVRAEKFGSEQLGMVELRIPSGLETVASGGGTPGPAGEASGTWKESAGGAVLTVTIAALPAEVKTLDALDERLRAHFEKEVKLVRKLWERREVNGHKVIYAELETVAGEQPETTFAFQWMQLDGQRLCTVQLAAPRLRFVVREKLYRDILRSLRPAGPSAAAPGR